MGRLGAYLALSIVAVVGASAAVAAVSPAGRQTFTGSGFPTAVTVTFTPPPGYRRIGGPTSSTYRGPTYTNLDTGNKIESTLDYSVHPDYGTSSAERGARRKIGTDIGGIPTREVASGTLSVPHLVGGRKVGVVRAFYVIRQATKAAYEGWFDAGLGFSAGKGYAVLVPDMQTNFPGDEAKHKPPDGTASTWNRRVIEQALRGVAIEGNLAPSKLAARVQARRVTGRVTDSLGHPLVGVKVTLRTAAGRSCCSVATSTTGAFALNVPPSAGAGALRLSVAVGGAQLTSTVRIG
jgi:hypothetical protein